MSASRIQLTLPWYTARFSARIASWAPRPGRNPYEHSMKSCSYTASSTSRTAPLDYLVLHRRYPYRPRPSVSLGDVHSPQWLMSVPLRLHSPVQLYEIRIKLLPVVLLAHPIHPHRRVTTQVMKGALQRRHVYQMRQ